MTAIAIIIARGGSKRLPGKNTMDFCGRPLIAWTIIQARACKYIEEVYVTTDSEEIADIAQEYGATVLMREDPRESIDKAIGKIPMDAALKRIAKMRSFDTVQHLFPTSPLRKPGDFDRLYQVVEKTGRTQGFFTIIKDAFIYKRIDSQSCLPIIKDKTGSYLYTIGGNSVHVKETQDAATDWNDKKIWLDPQPGEPGPVYYVLVDRWQAHEIDYQEDFDLCEFFFNRYLLDKWEAIYKKLPRGKRS